MEFNALPDNDNIKLHNKLVTILRRQTQVPQ